MNRPQSEPLWARIKWVLPAIAFVAIVNGILWGAVAWRLWDRRFQTASVRVVASGEVMSGNRSLDLDELEPELRRSAELFRSSGYVPRLLVEYCRDSRDTDVAAIAARGKQAGFVVVDTKALNWDSPGPQRPAQQSVVPVIETRHAEPGVGADSR
jgi:hypothetical protein